MTEHKVFQPRKKAVDIRKKRSLLMRVGIEGGTFQITDQIREGLPAETVERLRGELDVPLPELLHVVQIPPATYSRRRAADQGKAARGSVTTALKRLREGTQRLTAAESDRVYRVTKVVQLAEDLFEGDIKAAQAWLKRPAKALGGVAPLSILDTQSGTDSVIDLIGRMEHGVFS